MSTSVRIQKYQYVLYFVLVLTLLACGWIGWRDYDPYIAQEVVRNTIRASIRGLIQMAVQYIVPLAIVVYFANELCKRFALRKPRDADNSGA